MTRLTSIAGSFRWEGKAGYNSLTNERVRGRACGAGRRSAGSIPWPDLPARTCSGIRTNRCEEKRRCGRTTQGGWYRAGPANQGSRDHARANDWPWRTADPPPRGHRPAGHCLVAQPSGRMAALLVVPLLGVALLTLEWIWARYLLGMTPSLIMPLPGRGVDRAEDPPPGSWSCAPCIGAIRARAAQALRAHPDSRHRYAGHGRVDTRGLRRAS